MKVGDEWAYREKEANRTVRVVVARVGTRKPLRVKVPFSDDEFEGQELWVPATRLKVLWADVEEWQAREDRWLAVRTASRRAPDTLEYRAVQIVFEGLAELRVEDAYGRDTGLFVARNVPGPDHISGHRRIDSDG